LGCKKLTLEGLRIMEKNKEQIIFFIDHINTFSDIEKELHLTGAKYISMEHSKRYECLKVKFEVDDYHQRNKLIKLALEHDIDTKIIFDDRFTLNQIHEKVFDRYIRTY